MKTSLLVLSLLLATASAISMDKSAPKKVDAKASEAHKEEDNSALSDKTKGKIDKAKNAHNKIDKLKDKVKKNYD